jgi:hypothetical protein
MLVGLPNGVLPEDRTVKHRNSIVLTALILAVAACAGTDANKTGSDFTDLTAATSRVAPATSVGATSTAYTVAIGGSLQLTTKFVDAKGRKLVGSRAALVKWASSNSTIAIVSTTGVVKGVRDGVATITATYGKQTEATVVTVGAGSDTTPATPGETTPVDTTPTTTTPPPPTSSSEPLPRSGDRILMDGRVSMQQATSIANLWPGAPRGTVPNDQLTYELNKDLKFTSDFDGKGTNALRVDWTSFNGYCGDQAHRSITYLPAPYAKHIIVSFKQHMGRTATGGGIGELNSFQITNSGNGCDLNAGRKMMLMCRVQADGGCYNRMDYLYPGPAPVKPRIDNNVIQCNCGLLPGVAFNPQDYVGKTIVTTEELKAESSPGAADGIVRMWVNGVKIIENTHARIGAQAFNRFELTPTFNSPAQNQTEYIWDVVSWVPQG